MRLLIALTGLLLAAGLTGCGREGPVAPDLSQGEADGPRAKMAAHASTPQVGTQELHARWTDAPAEPDGTFAPGEYSAAIPFHVTFAQPDRNPGVLSHGGSDPQFTPSHPSDMSFTIYALYDEENLYVAVNVRDDILFTDTAGIPAPSGFWHHWADDSVELRLAGFGQVAVTASGFRSHPFFSNWFDGWSGAAGERQSGYLVEFVIPLYAIDVEPGGIRFNVTVNDDDNGGWGYNDDGEGGLVTEGSLDSFGMWAGDPDPEAPPIGSNPDAWGTLFFD